jgi:uncharacterized Fe-S cluster protein YjdI
MSESVVKEYSNGEVTIVWKPNVCIHSANCVKGLPSVFNLKNKPWIDAKGATSDEIIGAVSKCPSGALTYYKNDEVKAAEPAKEVSTPVSPFEVTAFKNGPILIKGDFIMKDSDGSDIECKGQAWICRCGQSNRKPFCDGTHKKIEFIA